MSDMVQFIVFPSSFLCIVHQLCIVSIDHNIYHNILATCRVPASGKVYGSSASVHVYISA